MTNHSTFHIERTRSFVDKTQFHVRPGTRRVCLFVLGLERYKNRRASLTILTQLTNISNSQLHSHVHLPSRTRCSAALRRAHRRLSLSPRAHTRSLPYTSPWRHTITRLLFCVTVSGTGRTCLSGSQQLVSLWLLRRLGVLPPRLRRLLCARRSRLPAAYSSAGHREQTRPANFSPTVCQPVWIPLLHLYHLRPPRRLVLYL